MGKETSTRIQTSILNALEKKALVWLAGKQPRWMTSDVLTYIGVLGAVVCAVGFALANLDIRYLWLSSLGLVINWYGDSLDGTLARVRNTQRPVYGFFIDHYDKHYVHRRRFVANFQIGCCAVGIGRLFGALYLYLCVYHTERGV